MDFTVGKAENDETLDALADRMVARHWHVQDLPWADLPPLPIPADADPRRRRAIIEFGKRAIYTQLAAEHVAVAAAHQLLRHAERTGLPASARRALAALLNDEASHVSVMAELAVRADRAYPDVVVVAASYPLFDTFVSELPRLHPALIAIAMGSYEAMIAIRSYAEEASYRHPSILGRMAELAALDDANHARVLRLVSHLLLDDMRRTIPDTEAHARAIQEQVLDPLQAFWPLVCEHERSLMQHDERFEPTLNRRLAADGLVVRRLLTSLRIGAPNLRETSAVRG
jgi:hypothetical protein